MSHELKRPHCKRLAAFTPYERCSFAYCLVCPSDGTWLACRYSIRDKIVAANANNHTLHMLFVCSSCGECVS